MEQGSACAPLWFKSIDRCSSLRYPHLDRTPHASRKIAHHGGAFFVQVFRVTQQPSINLASVPAQVQHLIDHGMTVNNRGFAERSLTHIGFERLSSYWKTLRIIDTGQTRESLRERDALQFCPITLPVRQTAQVPSAGGFQLH